MTFGANQRTKVNQAAAKAVQKAFGRLGTNWGSSRWLKVGNRYASKTKEKIKNDTVGNKIVHKHLSEYVSASTVIHCIDGWAYLGRAIDAHLRGDSDTSRHLGYYAELRAAMALMASEGIGVFDTTHCIVDQKGKCHGFRADGTHRFLWDAMDYWASLPTSQALIFKVIEPGGVALEQWLTRFSVGPGFRAIISQTWLKEWGLDLKRIAQDREDRNLASYRPTAFHSPGALPVAQALTFVKELWEICEPSDSLPFKVLDRQLLQHSLDLAFKSAHASRSPRQAKTMFDRQVRSMLHTMPPTDMNDTQWIDFFRSNLSRRRPQIFEEARGIVGPEDRRHHRQVIARATLLLRLASGACQLLLRSAGGDPQSDLRFWWNPLGQDRGLWMSGAEPASFVDLWVDVRDAIRSIEDWRTRNVGAESYRRLWSDQGGAVATLGISERIGLWSIGL